MDCVDKQQKVKGVDALKQKIICDYKKLINHLNKGKYTDYQFILEEISIVELQNDLDYIDYLIQYYLNTHD